MEEWEEDEIRSSKLVFIGKNLDAAALRAGFASCLATPENLEKKRAALRFDVGQRVLCNMGGDDGWVKATITMQMWRDDEDMDPGMVACYQVACCHGARARIPTTLLPSSSSLPSFSLSPLLRPCLSRSPGPPRCRPTDDSRQRRHPLRTLGQPGPRSRCPLGRVA